MKNKVEIGRDELSDIRIDGSYTTVSNGHADICNENGTLVFYDHSTNGTLINGKDVHGTSHALSHGDKILLAGKYELRWEEIDKFFPPQRKTRPFNPDEVGDGRKTRPFNPDEVGDRRKTRPFNPDEVGDGRKTRPFNPDEVGDGRKTRPFNPDEVDDGRKTKPYGKADGRTVIDGSNDGRTVIDGAGHQKPKSQPATSYCPQAEIDEACQKWNWGAFLGNWVWAACHKRYWPLAVLVLIFIPYIGMVCHLSLSSYLGLNGSRIAWDSGKYDSMEKFNEAQHKWIAIGGVVFVLSAIVNLLIFYMLMTY